MGRTIRGLRRLTKAVAAGGRLPALVAAMQAREAERATIQREVDTMSRASSVASLSASSVEKQLREKIDDWKGLLARRTPQARQVLKKLLAGPIKFTPHAEGETRFYEFTAPIALGRILEGSVLALMVASQGLPSWNQVLGLVRKLDNLRSIALPNRREA